MRLITGIRSGLLTVRGWVRKTRDAIDEYERGTHAKQNSRPEETHPPEPIEVRAVLSYDDDTVRRTNAEAQHQSRIQASIKRATWAAFFAASVYAALAAYQANEMRKATIAAQQSANTATAQLETTDRPWVKAVPQSWSPITFRDNGDLSFGVTFALSNVGRSVATDVTIYSGAFIPTWGDGHFTQPLERQADLCNKTHAQGIRLALFPGDTKQLSVGLTISREEMERNPVPQPPGMTSPSPPGKRTDPILFGCVDYRFGSLLKNHQTGFIYTIVRVDPKTPNLPYLIIVGQNLPAPRVNLQTWPFGGDYAN